MASNRPCRPRQSGFSLTEVLVVLVITAVGLLGAAALQGRVLTSGKTAHLRSIANQALGDIGERMHANVQGHVGGLSYAWPGNWKARAGAKPTPPDCAAGCTPAQVTEADLLRWQRTIAESLPDGAGFVLGTPATGYQVVVAWREADRDLAGADIASGCPAALSAPAGVRCLVAAARP